jgi:hypothetical protein
MPYTEIVDEFGRTLEGCSMCGAAMSRDPAGANPTLLRITDLSPGEFLGEPNADGTGGVMFRDDHPGICSTCVERHARPLFDLIIARHADQHRDRVAAGASR